MFAKAMFRRRDGEVHILIFLRVVLERYTDVIGSRRQCLHAGNILCVDREHREIVRNRDAAIVSSIELAQGNTRHREALSEQRKVRRSAFRALGFGVCGEVAGESLFADVLPDFFLDEC